MTKPGTTVTASVICTGELDRLRPCLDSLAAQTFEGEIRIVVVCNGEPEGTDALVREMDPSVTTIVNATRRGFAENHNAALAAIPSDFGLILNPDVVLEPDCVGALVAAMRRHMRAGVVGPALRYPDGTDQPSARRFPRLLGTLVRRTPLRRIAAARVRRSGHYLPPATDDRPVDWMLGACLLVRGHAWRAIGGFDPGFRPLYVEDIDLGWRMWSAGWEVWQTPHAVALHEHQAATDKTFLDRRTLWHARGMLRFVRKHPRILVSGDRPEAPPVVAR